MVLDGRVAVMTDEVVKPESIPAVYEHACRVYAEMFRLARPADDEIDQALMIYEGHLTQLFKKLRLSVPYYTMIKNRLVEMGCIEQLKRGGGSAESKWLLWKEPRLTEWNAVSGDTPRAKGDWRPALEQRIRDLTSYAQALEVRVVDLERDLETLRGIVERYDGHNV